MDAQLSYTVYLVNVGACYKCGVTWAIPKDLYQRLRDKGGAFYCPNGHSQCYAETTEQRMQKQIDAQRRRAEMAERRTENERAETKHQERRAAAFKGNVTKLKGRIANGVCPCCNRSFENLSRHMKTKHPGFDPNDGEAT